MAPDNGDLHSVVSSSNAFHKLFFVWSFCLKKSIFQNTIKRLHTILPADFFAVFIRPAVVPGWPLEHPPSVAGSKSPSDRGLNATLFSDNRQAYSLLHRNPPVIGSWLEDAIREGSDPPRGFLRFHPGFP